MNRHDWFKQAKFGMMIHWGLYALPAGEWKGRRMADIGELVETPATLNDTWGYKSFDQNWKSAEQVLALK